MGRTGVNPTDERETSQRATHQPTFLKAALLYFSKVTQKSKEPVDPNLIPRSQMLKNQITKMDY